MKRIILTLLTLTLTACNVDQKTPNEPSDSAASAWGDASTITAAQLKSCPLAKTLEQGKIDPAVNACTKGVINGVTMIGSKEKCSLTIDGAGTLAFSSPTLTTTITLKDQTYVDFTHTVSNGVHTLLYGLNDRPANTEIGFSYFESITSSSLQNLSITVKNGQQSATCVTRL